MILLRKKSDPKWLMVVNRIGSIIFMFVGLIVSSAAGLGGSWTGSLLGGALGAIAWMPFSVLIRLVAVSLTQRVGV